VKFVKPQQTLHPNILLYGPPKTGKTTGACTAPGSIGLLNCDLPNASWYAHQRDAEGRIKEIVYEQFETLIEVITELRAEGNTLDSVVVDPVGELHRRVLEDQSARAVRPSLNQYGDTSTHIERFCRALCELPVTAVFVCHEYPVKDEGSGQLERLPWTGTTNPALGSKLMGMVDIVGYTGVVEHENGEREYIAQLVTQQGRRGGDRFGGVLGDWAPVNIERWMSIIGATKEELAAA
jgi:hypothetical protein